MSLNIRKLSPELQKIACEQLFEDPSTISESIKVLKDWIAKSPHLRSRTDDQFLVMFLRCCKYSIEKAKIKIDLFYTLRTHTPEWMKDRNPQKARLGEILRLGGMLPLPQVASPDAPRVILVVVGGFDPAVYSIDELLKNYVLVSDLMMDEDDQMIVAGQVNIIDLKNATLAHFMAFTPTILKKLTTMMQEGSAFRVKAIHYINVPSFFESAFTFFKQFLNEKIKSRLYVHSGDMTSLHQVIPKSILPTEYGGDAGSIDQIAQYWEDKILAKRDYLIELTKKYGVDEKKRIGRPKNPETLFGFDGSFRQMQFD